MKKEINKKKKRRKNRKKKRKRNDTKKKERKKEVLRSRSKTGGLKVKSRLCLVGLVGEETSHVHHSIIDFYFLCSREKLHGQTDQPRKPFKNTSSRFTSLLYTLPTKGGYRQQKKKLVWIIMMIVATCKSGLGRSVSSLKREKLTK